MAPPLATTMMVCDGIVKLATFQRAIAAPRHEAEHHLERREIKGTGKQLKKGFRGLKESFCLLNAKTQEKWHFGLLDLLGWMAFPHKMTQFQQIIELDHQLAFFNGFIRVQASLSNFSFHMYLNQIWRCET